MAARDSNPRRQEVGAQPVRVRVSSRVCVLVLGEDCVSVPEWVCVAVLVAVFTLVLGPNLVWASVCVSVSVWVWVLVWVLVSAYVWVPV